MLPNTKTSWVTLFALISTCTLLGVLILVNSLQTPLEANSGLPGPFRHGVKRVVTAYNSVPEQTDSTPCIGADGTNICNRYNNGEKICAANFVPLGTIIVVDNLGPCTVADKLNNRYPNRVDVYFGMDIWAARQWGRRELLVRGL